MLSVVRTAPPTELDAATLRRAAAGDDAACRTLVELYQARVFALVSRMLARRGRATVEDAAQETFLQVFRQLAKFDPKGSARLSTWILTIAARRAIDELRRQRPMLVAEPEQIELDRRGDERAIRRELAQAIEGALRDLSPELRAAFLLREYHDLDYGEIASSLGIELGTVKSRLARARAALRQRLAEVHRE
ncbi:MAG: RNA polymerase sigma factor [Kofleriaceae bacterium]